MSKHTPGEWKAEQQKNIASGKYEWVIKIPENDVVSRIIATTPYPKKYNDHEANARLIASAPELLEACKQLIRKDVQECSVLWEQAVLDAKQAIAKAEGEK